MKVELQISETYKEEKLIVQAPQETDKIQKVIEFAENLDQKETIKGKIVFIHGNGDGVLRKSILQELKYKYKNYESQDASFREYGFGATMVIIH